ncbi:hypothetical protein ColKHC_06766 [Colletotrichum higginsianum]|uniref:Celp0028 effector like protein n=1 Tax=Colletotrichum higginsianum TaxID=80884 RepID=A0A4T0VJC6_9PEZI|nr:hypothetical protein CH35J_010860 [Colletotrichum higginsianum]GJC97940.1 hypothetical protein ColKHC_06766 [Colletotrichum higginsianum]
MVSSNFLAALGLAAAALAAPNRPRMLSADDVILLGHDGTPRIMKAAAYEALETAAAAAPVSLSSYNTTTESTTTPALARRGCERSTEIQVTSDESFLNWDVAISPVASSRGNTAATIGVSAGFELGNSLAIGSEITIGNDVIGVSLGMDLDVSWSTSLETSLEYEVPDGLFGVIVSQPYVRRVAGNVLAGCTDSPFRTPFVADAYESQNYGGLSWVKGVIRLCSSETYPIPYCIGQGTHK